MRLLCATDMQMVLPERMQIRLIPFLVTDVDAIALMCREEGVDGIITSFSDLLLECMVKIADKAGLPCYLKPEQLSWYRDKSACRDVLDKLGLAGTGFGKYLWNC